MDRISSQQSPSSIQDASWLVGFGGNRRGLISWYAWGPLGLHFWIPVLRRNSLSICTKSSLFQVLCWFGNPSLYSFRSN